MQTADALSNIEYTVGITAAVSPRKSASRFGVIALAGASLLVLVGASAYAVSKSHAKTEPISARTAPPPAEATVPLPSASVAPVAPPPVPPRGELPSTGTVGAAGAAKAGAEAEGRLHDTVSPSMRAAPGTGRKAVRLPASCARVDGRS